MQNQYTQLLKNELFTYKTNAVIQLSVQIHMTFKFNTVQPMGPNENKIAGNMKQYKLPQFHGASLNVAWVRSSRKQNGCFTMRAERKMIWYLASMSLCVDTHTAEEGRQQVETNWRSSWRDESTGSVTRCRWQMNDDRRMMTDDTVPQTSLLKR